MQLNHSNNVTIEFNEKLNQVAIINTNYSDKPNLRIEVSDNNSNSRIDIMFTNLNELHSFINALMEAYHRSTLRNFSDYSFGYPTTPLSETLTAMTTPEDEG